MTIDEKKQYLMQYSSSCGRIRKLNELKQRCIGQAESVSPVYSDMPKAASNQSKIESAVCQIIDIERQISKEKEKSDKLLAKIENAIESLSNPRERDVLYMRYIIGGYRLMKYDEIAEGLNYSVRQIMRYRDSGLEHINLD